MLSIREVAIRLRISVALAYSLVSSGQLHCYRFGVGRGAIRVSDEQLQAYMEKCKKGRRRPDRLPQSHPARSCIAVLPRSRPICAAGTPGRPGSGIP